MPLILQAFVLFGVRLAAPACVASNPYAPLETDKLEQDVEQNVEQNVDKTT